MKKIKQFFTKRDWRWWGYPLSFAISFGFPQLLMLCGLSSNVASVTSLTLIITTIIVGHLLLYYTIKDNWPLARYIRPFCWWIAKMHMVDLTREKMGVFAYPILVRIELGETRKIFIESGFRKAIEYVVKPPDDDRGNEDDGFGSPDPLPEDRRLAEEAKLLAREMHINYN